jgi:hypothetical protein
MVSDMQVWIDSQVIAGQTIVVPYVKSDIDRNMRYRLDVIKKGASGLARISQGGTVLAVAEKPVSLSRTSIDVRQNDTCTLEIVLTEKGVAIGTYRFDCPR